MFSNDLIKQNTLPGTLNAVNREFESRSGHTKYYRIGFVASLLNLQYLGVRTNSIWLGIRITRPS